MANFTEDGTYPAGIHIIETDEYVLGGVDGPSNAPIKQLANRTGWLKNNMFTKNEVNQKISDLINSAPGVLDTLKELADALGNDADFSTTIINLINTERTERQNADVLLSSSSNPEINYTGKDSGFTVINAIYRKYGKVVFGSIKLTSTHGDDTYRFLGSINPSPDITVNFPGVCSESVMLTQGASGFIATGGEMYIATGIANKYYSFNFTYILP